MVRDRIRAELRDLDQRAGDAVENARGRARGAVQRARYRRALRRDEKGSLRERVSRDADRSRQDIEPGTDEGNRLREAGGGLRSLLSGAASAAGSLAAGQERADTGPRSDETARRAFEASMVSPPTDAGIQPVDDRGLGTLADFARGRRPADGIERYEMVSDSGSTIRWRATHDDGATTIVMATESDNGWVVQAMERSPAGRENGDVVIDRGLASRREARERALDWIERNPDGIPLPQAAGQAGIGGYAAGGSLVGSSIVFDADGLGAPMGGDGGLVGDDDLAFIVGGDDP